ncbi:MAG: alpha/beta hydrolase family protein [Opitutaceae bacterium]
MRLFIRSFVFAVVMTSLPIARGADSGSIALPLDPDQHKLIETDRPDGRYLATRGFVQSLMRNARPKLTFDSSFSAAEFARWKAQVRAKMIELIRFPEVASCPKPKLLSRVPRTGYSIEKWEIYPLPGWAVRFLVLVPNSASSRTPAPAIVCFPGSARSKESLAGEPELNPKFAYPPHANECRMAYDYAQQGIVAVALDNPGIAEMSDIGTYVVPGGDRTTFSRYLIDLGWSYLGCSAFVGKQVLGWLRSQDFVDRERIALSGQSLGTEPVIALAVIDPKICAVVFNDFLCPNILRATVSTKPTAAGVRPQANDLTHCIPGMWEWFDYPDLMASVAPTPLLFTEGGVTNELDRVRAAYRITNAPEMLEIHYYSKYRNPQSRRDGVKIPEGLDAEEWYRYANVDPPNHYFHGDIAVPWLTRVIRSPKANH